MIKNMIKAQTLKGFRDFLPKEARKRQYVADALRKVFESYGFEPLETPTLEYEEILLGKYGEEGDKLMYRFTDNGKRKVAMRYDQTVPLARVVSQYQNSLPMPFKRYQIQNVWRAENTQKGRFREFLQCDADIVGINSPLSDTEVVFIAAKALEKLGFKNFKILINDRTLLAKYETRVLGSIDKIKKINEKGVIKELEQRGFSDAKTIVEEIKSTKKSENLAKIESYFSGMGYPLDLLQFDPTLVRGLDYYTGLIFEIEIEGYSAGSVCGGGRYDNLIGMFANKSIPAVGFAFGFDRLIEAMEEFNLFPQDVEQSITKVLVTIFSAEFLEKSLEISSRLRSNNINTEIYLEETISLEKQLKYADQKGIPYALIVGPDEVSKNMVTVRNMKTREQKTVEISKIKDQISEIN